MPKRLVLTLVALGTVVSAACNRPEQVEVESPVGEPTPIPGPTLAPPVPPDTGEMHEDTLPVLQQDTV